MAVLDSALRGAIQSKLYQDIVLIKMSAGAFRDYTYTDNDLYEFGTQSRDLDVLTH